MAFIDLQNEEEEEARNEQDQPQLSREPGVISGSSVAARTGTKPSDTNFTNVGQYIEANKEGIGQMADNITGGIKSQVGKAEADLDKSLGQFKGQQRVIGDYSDIASALGKEGGVFGLTDAQKGTVRELATSGYRPSTDLEGSQDYQKALQEKQKALGLLTLAGNEAGTSTLIKETMKPQQYSRGEMALDVGLLRTEPGARKSFTELASQRPEFESRLQGKAREAADFAANQRRQYEAAQAAIRQAGANRFEAIKASDSPEAIQAERDKRYQQARFDLDQKLAKADAMFKESGIYDPNWDLREYLADVSPEAFEGIRTLLTDEQIEEMATLNEILGLNQDLPQLRQPVELRYPYGFDFDAFQRELNDVITFEPMDYMPEHPLLKEGQVLNPITIRRSQLGKIDLPKVGYLEKIPGETPEQREERQRREFDRLEADAAEERRRQRNQNRDNRRFAQIPILSDIF